jgi:hypothetical protein
VCLCVSMVGYFDVYLSVQLHILCVFVCTVAYFYVCVPVRLNFILCVLHCMHTHLSVSQLEGCS